MPAAPIKRIAPNPPGRHWGHKTRHVVDCIRELVAIDDVWTYAMCLDLCGVDLQGADDHLRDSIKAYALEYGIVLEAVPGVGYQRLSEPSKVDKHQHKDLPSISRKAHRLQAEQATVQVRGLSALDQHRHLVTSAVASHVQAWTAPRKLRELVEAKRVPALPPFDVAAHKDLFTTHRT